MLGQRPCVIPAQGNALVMMNQTDIDSAQRANLSCRCEEERLVRWTEKTIPFSFHNQGVALGWENFRPFGAVMRFKIPCV
ncbi:MAG: hypothetical protein ABSE63_11805 [Thermoguttaceae bacterium]